MAAKRDYKKEYDDYQGKSEQIARRSERNKARRKLGLAKGDPREAAHQNAPRTGSLKGIKVKAESFEKNRTSQPKRSGPNQKSGV